LGSLPNVPIENRPCIMTSIFWKILLDKIKIFDIISENFCQLYQKY
jgi:hypothetical protein